MLETCKGTTACKHPCMCELRNVHSIAVCNHEKLAKWETHPVQSKSLQSRCRPPRPQAQDWQSLFARSTTAAHEHPCKCELRHVLSIAETNHERHCSLKLKFSEVSVHARPLQLVRDNTRPKFHQTIHTGWTCRPAGTTRRMCCHASFLPCPELLTMSNGLRRRCSLPSKGLVA